MIRFHSLMLLKSTRWFGAAVVTVIWASLVMTRGNETTLARAGGMLFCHVIVGAWLGFLVGDLDDDAHRELVTAATRTPGRLHVLRAVTAWVWSATSAVSIVAVSLIVHRHSHPFAIEALASTGIAVAGSLLGVAIGAPLHRPVVRKQSTSLGTAALCLVGLAILPAMQRVLREVSSENASHVPALFAAACVFALATTATAVVMTNRIRR
jgi:hypothetical protein